MIHTFTRGCAYQKIKNIGFTDTFGNLRNKLSFVSLQLFYNVQFKISALVTTTGIEIWQFSEIFCRDHANA